MRYDNHPRLTKEQIALITAHATTVQPFGFWTEFCKAHDLRMHQVIYVRRKCGMPMRANSRRAA